MERRWLHDRGQRPRSFGWISVEERFAQLVVTGDDRIRSVVAGVVDMKTGGGPSESSRRIEWLVVDDKDEGGEGGAGVDLVGEQRVHRGSSMWFLTGEWSRRVAVKVSEVKASGG